MLLLERKKPCLTSELHYSGGIHSLAPVDAHNGGKPRKDLAEGTADGVRQYLDPIFEVADKYLKSPDSEPLDKASIPLFMLATGGMRSLKQSHYEAFQILRKAITDYLNASGYFEPVYDTISGEDEGIFGWLAANHETGRLQAEEPPRGFMEMGGQSAQIAFEPSEDDKEHYEGPLTAVNLGNRTYYVFTKTWPMLGADAMWRKHEQRLREKKAEEDPCLPRGYNYKLADSDITIKGTGDPELKACLRETWSLLECQDAACTAGELCALRKGGPGGCLLKDIPGLGFHGQGKGGSFLGASVFWHATNGVFGAENPGQGDSKKSSEQLYNVMSFFLEVKDLFSHDWEEIKSLKSREEVNKYKYLPKAFFKACLIMTTLHLGFGLPMPTLAMKEVSQAIRDFVQEANGNNGIVSVSEALELATFPSDADGRFTTVEAASWTLGRIILCAVHCTPRLMTCDGWKKRPVTPVQLQTDVD
jgi:Golgi nucleoside diphosphatase